MKSSGSDVFFGALATTSTSTDATRCQDRGVHQLALSTQNRRPTETRYTGHLLHAPTPKVCRPQSDELPAIPFIQTLNQSIDTSMNARCRGRRLGSAFGTLACTDVRGFRRHRASSKERAARWHAHMAILHHCYELTNLYFYSPLLIYLFVNR